jgi:cystathionine gamma-synthase
MSPEARKTAGIAEGLIRFSVGIEDPGDLVADMNRALRACFRADADSPLS